jgi:hypothetical protein
MTNICSYVPLMQSKDQLSIQFHGRIDCCDKPEKKNEYILVTD